MPIQMIDRDKILKVVAEKGPLIPAQLKKELGGDTILLGALLSELASTGKIKITHAKIGGSPAYYTPGTEERLSEIEKYLNEKDRRTVELLKEKKVLRDCDETPLVRVSLRNIRDFAKPLEVTVKNKQEIFWKWHLTPEQEAQDIILKSLKISSPKKEEIAVSEKEGAPLEEEKKPEQKAQPKEKKEEPRQEDTVEQKIEKDRPAKPKAEKTEREKPSEKIAEKPLQKKQEIEVQSKLGKGKEELSQEKDAFFNRVKKYFEENSITIIDYQLVRKAEIDFTISVPSNIGSHEFYCKAKNKKKINDGDLSSAYIQGQTKKMPILFVSTGELTKRAKEMLAKEFKGMSVKSI